MAYESPALRHQGALSEVLLRLVPRQNQSTAEVDWRIHKLIRSIDSKTGSLEWNLEDACRELKLDISSAYAARLFKRHYGMGIRQYAKKKRLSMAAEQLAATDRSVKAIAAEFGYRKPVDFSRVFKQ